MILFVRLLQISKITCLAVFVDHTDGAGRNWEFSEESGFIR